MPYVPLPSLGGKYEIDGHRNVRNAKTKRKLKPMKRAQTNYYNFFFGKKSTRRSVNQLMFEAFGYMPPTPSGGEPIPVTIVNDKMRKHFPSLNTAAKFLAADLHYSVSSMIRLLSKKRADNIYGWQIMYREPEKRILRDTTIINGDKYLHRENKYFENLEKNFYSDNKTV